MAYSRKRICGSADPRSHLPPGPGWPAPPVSSSPASDTPPDAASGRWLRPTDPPPSAAGPVAGGCRWARRPLLTRLESEPGRRRSACSLHCLWRAKDTRRQTVRQRHKATQSGAAGWDNHTGGGISSTTAWAEESDKRSSVCPPSRRIPGCCPLFWRSPSCRPMFLTGCNGPCPLCPLPLLSPRDTRDGDTREEMGYSTADWRTKTHSSVILDVFWVFFYTNFVQNLRWMLILCQISGIGHLFKATYADINWAKREKYLV